MKAKFLPFLLLTVLLQVSMFSFAHEMISARQIRLKNKTEVQHRSIPVTPDAFIENSLLSIDLLSTVPHCNCYHQGCRDGRSGLYIY